ncbi:MAG: AAA family ATPase [Patescibacteria group bacterium]
MANKLILGLTGFMKAGKTTSAKYLEERYGAIIFRNSALLEATLKLWDLPLDRDHYSELCRAMMRWKGQGIIATTNYTAIRRAVDSQEREDGHALVVIDGIRMPGGLQVLHTMDEFKLAVVRATFDGRYQRMLQNPEKDDEVRGMSKARFLTKHLIWAERRTLWCMLQADTEVQNYGWKDELHDRLDVMMERYGFPRL